MYLIYARFSIILKETVAGQYESELYFINGLLLESRKRREHLTRDDLQKNKAIIESLTKGGHSQSLDQNGEVKIVFFCELEQIGILLIFFIRY